MSDVSLRADEQILWEGQPASGFYISKPNQPGIWFSIFAMFLGGWGIYAAQGTRKAIVSDIFNGLLLLLVFYIFYSSVFGGRRRRRTYYLLTNQRAIIREPHIIPYDQEIKLADLPEVALEPAEGGYGTIRLGRDVPGRSGRGGMTWAPRFEYLANAEHIYQLIEQVRAKAPNE